MSSGSDILITPSKSALCSIEKNVTCTEDGCSQTFIHAGALNLHLVKTHGKFRRDEDKMLFHNRKKLSSPRIVYHCPEPKCRYAEGGAKNFPKYSLLKQHYLKSHAKAKFLCGKCELQFSVESWRDRHQTDCGTLFQCGSCPVKYTTRHVLHTHCKRHEHTYPEEYSQQEAEAASMKRKTSKPGPTSKTLAVITVTPIVMVAMPTPKPKPLPKPIICKPLSEPNQSAVKVLQQTATKAVRQDAMMQTDIYGISNLAVKGHELSSSNSVGLPSSNTSHGKLSSNSSHGNLVNVASSFEAVPASRFPLKKTAAAKRKLSIGSVQDQNALISPPRRKKTKSTTGMQTSTKSTTGMQTSTKSTTGMQTSVSLTQKRRAQMMSGTQTTGDYILKKAMAKADIPIERKTVASQVTPQKPKLIKNKMCSSETQTGGDRVENNVRLDKDVVNQPGKPTLVDSFSQVKQRHIWAETSHNLAERQTMTDLPPSISTQTLQSYLVNQQERNRLSKEQKSRVGSVVGMTRSDSGLNTMMVDRSCDTVTEVGTILDGNATNFENAVHVARINKEGNRNGEDIVKMYNEQLEAPVSVLVPNKGKSRVPRKQTISQQILDTPSSGIVPVALRNGKNTNSNISIMTQSDLKESNIDKEVNESVIQSVNADKPKQIIASTSGILYNPSFPTYLNSSVSGVNQGIVNTSVATTFTTQTSLPHDSVAMASDVAMATAVGLTTDTEAQAMSATEFESLLQSSGIFLDNADFVMDHNKLSQVESESQTMTSGVMTSNIMTDSLGLEFDFLSSSHTMDMDTQTAFDFSLFDNCTAIDTNTQTGTDIDLLDLVMTNMETQTLNEDDLASLGLGSVRIDSQANVGQLHTQSLGVGTSDLDFPDHGSNPVQSVVSVAAKTACVNNQSTVLTNNPRLDSDAALNMDAQTMVGVRHQFVSSNQYRQNSQNQTTTGTSPLFDIEDSLQASGYGNQSQSKLLGDPASSLTLTSLEMQTQTVGCDAIGPPFQTETQTQVDSRDTVTEYVTMETQTTMEDLEQLASWFD